MFPFVDVGLAIFFSPGFILPHHSLIKFEKRKKEQPPWLTQPGAEQQLIKISGTIMFL